MVGGATSGYCATGSAKKATAPTIVMNSERTIAKIGLLMKECEKRIIWPSALGGCVGGLQMRLDLHAWPHPHQSLHHDPIGRQQAAGNDPHRMIFKRAGLDPLRHDPV